MKTENIFDNLKRYHKGVQYVLNLDCEKALDFFMKSDQYCTFELPKYFEFDKLLDFVRNTVGDKDYDDCVAKGADPKALKDVNVDIILNKDGKYAVRPLMLVNPYLYYFLVRELCSKKGWKAVRDCFGKYNLPHIMAGSMPVVPTHEEKFHKSATILNWWNTMEQRSIELSLEYRYMFVTDITNCYGSINPRSFDLAFGMKNTKYATNKNHAMSDNIQKYLCAMQQGRNMGIPQGSVIFDLLAEIILGYTDLLLHEELEKRGIKAGYEILRYRDDYRIFCNDKGLLEDISYILQEVLERMNFRMNSQKTMISDSIITDAIKPDKRFYIYNTPIFHKYGTKHDKDSEWCEVWNEDFSSFEKYLLYVLMFGRKHPNSGQLKVMLSHLDNRMEKWLEPKERTYFTLNLEETASEDDKEEKVVVTYRRKLPGGSVRAMSAIAAQIAYENVSASSNALVVLSRIVDSSKDDDEKRDIIKKVHIKFKNQHNATYNQLWLQHITYQKDKESGESFYDMPLCRIVAGEKNVVLWNNSWLKKSLTKAFSQESIVNQEVLDKITPVIELRHKTAYDDDYAGTEEEEFDDKLEKSMPKEWDEKDIPVVEESPRADIEDILSKITTFPDD